MEEQIARKQREARERLEAQRRAEQEKREAARRAEEERRQAARAREQERQEAARRKEQERLAEIARKRQMEIEAKERAERARKEAMEIEAKRRATAAAQRLAEMQARARQKENAELDRRLNAILSDKKQTPAAREIAAIALGRDSTSSALPRGQIHSKVDRDVAKAALARVRQSAQTQLSSDQQLSAIMNDPNESVAARRIASIALGVPAPASQATLPTPAPGATVHSFKLSASGNVQVFRDGVPLTTTTREIAIKQFGFSAAPPNANTPVASTPQRISPTVASAPAAALPLVDFYRSGKIGGASSPVVVAPGSTQGTKLWSALETVHKSNTAVLESRPGRILTDTLSAAGGAYAPGWAKAVHTTGDIAAAADHIRKKDYWALAQQGVDKATVKVGGTIGALATPANPVLGEAAGSATTQAIISAGHYYLAPVVGDWMFKNYPQLFTPAPAGPQLAIDPFTQKAIPPGGHR